MLCTRNRTRTIRATRPTRLCVEPVLSGVLNIEVASDALACLGRHAASSVYPVDLLVITLDLHKLQPRHRAQSVGSRARILWRIALLVYLSLDVAEVDLVSLQLEQRHTLLGELVVARQPALSNGRVGDGELECNLGDGGENSRGAHTVAGCVEQRRHSTNCFGCLARSRSRARVVLGASSNGNVAELETIAWSGKTCLRGYELVSGCIITTVEW
jgi:hypothetical protein